MIRSRATMARPSPGKRRPNGVSLTPSWARHLVPLMGADLRMIGRAASKSRRRSIKGAS
jgi:hypothetical protein